MRLTLQIPDDLAQRPEANPSDLSWRALEALALEEFCGGRMTKAELRRMPGFETREALDGFLKADEIFIDYTLDDLEQYRRDLRRIGL